ncbi:MAG: T9SS type A sorting domain-containing protein [Bacteroidota bacterium]
MMKAFIKTILSIIVFVLITTDLLQAQITKFEKIYGGNDYDYGYSVLQTYDKGYIVAGATTSFGSGNTHAYILKTDNVGIPKWHRSFGGINIDQAYSIKQTTDSGYVIAGYTNSFGFGGYDMYVIKTDKYGNVIWEKTYGGSNWDFAYSIDTTADGGYIIAGGTYSYGKGNEDMYLVKINSAGDTLWTKTYGGTNEDEARSVIQTSDSGYILTGFTKSMGNVNGDMYTVKTNSTGDTLWTNKYGGLQEDIAYEVIESSTGEYIVAGKTKSVGNGNFDGLILFLSPTGSVNYAPTYGGTGNDGFHSIVRSAYGRLAMVGYTYTFGLGESDFLGFIENPFNGFHSATFGNSKMEIAYCIRGTNDNGYIICGTSASYSNLDHIYLIKTDSNGVASGSVTIVVTDVNAITQSAGDFKLFPNPANDNVFLNIGNSSLINNNSFEITITDMLGREQYKKQFSNYTIAEPIEINVGQLNVGLYNVTIKNDKVTINQKLIIQH